MECSHANRFSTNNTKEMFDYPHKLLGSKLGDRTKERNNGFMSCLLQVDYRQSGWHKAVSAILMSSQASSFKMDEYGFVQVSGIADLNELLTSLEKKSRRVKVHNIWVGQCSACLLGPSLESIKAAAPRLKYPYHHSQEPEDEGITCCSLM